MAHAIWQGVPRDETAKAAKALGLPAEAFEQPDEDEAFIEVWPENRTAATVFCAMRTQWRMGFGGPYALDYTVIDFVARQIGIGHRALKAAFDDIQHMERAVIELIGRRKKD